MIFKNNRYFTKQTFEIQKSSLKIERKNLFDSIEHEISFDQIENKKKTETLRNSNLLITGVFFFIFSLLFQIGPRDELTIIFLSISFIFFICTFVNTKKVITITTYGSGNIELYFNKVNKDEVTEFANQIIKASNTFLLNKFTKIDRALPIEPQIDQLQFLRNKEIISEQHYEALKDQLLGRDSKSSIGFHN